MNVSKDMWEFLELMDEMSEMITITEEVDAHNFELSSLIRHSEAGPNKVVYFQRVKGYNIPVVGNLLGSLRRCYLACGIEPQQEGVERYRDDPRGSGGPVLLTNPFFYDKREQQTVVSCYWAVAIGGKSRTTAKKRRQLWTNAKIGRRNQS